MCRGLLVFLILGSAGSSPAQTQSCDADVHPACSSANQSAGCVLDTFDNVPAYYNGSYNGKIKSWALCSDGWLYQCPEFVRRFYRIAEHQETSTPAWADLHK